MPVGFLLRQSCFVAAVAADPLEEGFAGPLNGIRNHIPGGDCAADPRVVLCRIGHCDVADVGDRCLNRLGRRG